MHQGNIAGWRSVDSCLPLCSATCAHLRIFPHAAALRKFGKLALCGC